MTPTKPHVVTVFEGDGIGPEITAATCRILSAVSPSVRFDRQVLGARAFEETGALVPPEALESVRTHHTVLKGPIATPVGSGFRSMNVYLRKTFDLYANIRPVQSIPGVPSRYPDIDLVVYRENTEDLYTGEETQVDPETAIAVKRITRTASERIIRLAFIAAQTRPEPHVTCVHKANILKLTDGLFLKTFREVAADFPDVRADDLIVDNACMQLVMRPDRFDILVMPNLYGDLLSDLGAGLIGGLGLLPSVNRNDEIAMFEAVHGSAPDIAGRDIANPTALILSACMMLEHVGLPDDAQKIRAAVTACLADPTTRTVDLGGSLGTTAFTDAILAKMGL